MDHQHGNGFQVLIYKDPYCSTRANVYNNYYDTSSLNVNFNYCKKCDYGYHSQYNSYDGNNDGYNGRLYYYYHNNNKAEQLFPMHASPLCSAMYAYREDCGFRCRRKAATVAKSSHSQIASGDGFFGSIFGSGDEYTGWEIFGISALSLSGKYLHNQFRQFFLHQTKANLLFRFQQQLCSSWVRFFSVGSWPKQLQWKRACQMLVLEKLHIAGPLPSLVSSLH